MLLKTLAINAKASPGSTADSFLESSFALGSPCPGLSWLRPISSLINCLSCFLVTFILFYTPRKSSIFRALYLLAQTLIMFCL